MAVANKQVDAAVHSSDVLERIQTRSPEVASRLRVGWKSTLIAGDPIVWRTDLQSDVKRSREGVHLLAASLPVTATGKDDLHE